MHLADLAARRSNCMKRRVGCVLVRAGRVISTGYNGTPRGVRNCNEGGCGRCNGGEGSGQGLSSCLCLHAEVPPPRTLTSDSFLAFLSCKRLMIGKCITGSRPRKNWNGSNAILQYVPTL